MAVTTTYPPVEEARGADLSGTRCDTQLVRSSESISDVDSVLEGFNVVVNRMTNRLERRLLL